MEPVRVISGPVSVLERADVDTDQIIPKQFLKRVERTGFGQFLFFDWAQEPGWNLPANPILATGPNFGSGSSREHAPWALQDYGFRAIVASSFADIFFSNCTKIGLLPVVLPEEEVRALMAAGEAEVDLEALEVRFAGRTVPFELEAERRRRLLEGLDDIALTLKQADAIDAYEAEREREGPVTTSSEALFGRAPCRAFPAGVASRAARNGGVRPSRRWSRLHGRRAFHRGRRTSMSVTPRRVLQLFLLAAALTALALAGVAAAKGRSRSAQAQASLAADSLRPPLTRDNFYFLMPDRFANGDTSNDRGGLSGAREVTGFDPTRKGWYHGGDLKGVISKLDYIKGLGTTAIWLTPSFKNKPVQGLGTQFPSAGYHGYWITDFTQIDPHLGTNQDLRDLIDGAHARGMKVFFDIITNHTADVIQFAENQYGYISKSAEPYRDANGTVFDDRTFAGTQTFPPLDPAVLVPVHARRPGR